MPLFLLGQKTLCRGSLGENIFEDGDFGRGIDNVYMRDPGIAPGYYYTNQFPLPDGFYTITNDIGRWYANWPTWLEIRDNSPDPYGYMMVVNASYEPGVFYEQVIEGVCENTLYEFSADVINIIQHRIRDHLLPNVSFLIDGVEKYNTGNIRQDESWKTVGFTFSTKRGQSSVRLTLRNNAPGGVGNDLALDNISFRACGPIAYIESDAPDVICENFEQPILTAFVQGDAERYIRWQFSIDQGETWLDAGAGGLPYLRLENPAPGRHLYRFVHAATKANLESQKCRAVSDVYELTVLPSEYTINRTIAPGQYVVFGGTRISEAGTYQQSLLSESGCDSVVTLVLTIEGTPPVAVEELAIALETSENKLCPGERTGYIIAQGMGGEPPYSYRWSQKSITNSIKGLAAGTYHVTVTDAKGREVTAEVIIHGFDEVEAKITGLRPATEGQGGDGRAAVAISGDASQTTFLWDNGEMGREARALTAGAHYVTVTIEDRCPVVLRADIPAKLMPALTADVLASGTAVRIEQLQFEADSSAIAINSEPVLEELYYFLLDNPSISVEIGGHTNALPDHDYCDRLSTERAKAVAEWLVTRGIPDYRLYYKGYGKRNPIASNSTHEGRLKNQRVEVKLVTFGK